MTERLPDTIGWKFWQQALKGKKVEVPLGVVPIGFYRHYARKRDIWWPLAIWVEENGSKMYQFGDAPPVLLATAEEELAFDYGTFQYAQKTPVSYDDYQFWKANREWPVAWGIHAPKKSHKPEFTDLKEVTSELGADPLTVNERAVPGNNSGATEEEIEKLTAEAFKDQVESIITLFDKDHAKIRSKAQADIAQGLRTRLTSLASQGDGEREIEKKPHLEAGRKVDEKWNPSIKNARAKAKDIQTAVTEFGRAEQRRLNEEHQAMVAAEMAKGEIPATKPPVVTFQGASGRKSSMVETWDIEIVDHDAVYAILKNNSELQAFMLMLVKRAHGVAKAEFKGATYTKRMVAS